MKFLDVYPSVLVLEARHPGITGAIHRDKLTALDNPPAADLYMRHFKLFLTHLTAAQNIKNARLFLLQAVSDEYLKTLMWKEKYTAEELLTGLRILFGAGKGQNDRYSLEIKSGVILKYGSRESATTPGPLVHEKIAHCVGLAKTMAQQAKDEIDEYCDDYPNSVARKWLAKDILIFHFGCGASNDELAALRDISKKYETIARSLVGHIIIADIEKERTLGLVKVRNYNPKNSPLPLKTLGISKNSKRVLMGSIHIDFNWVEDNFSSSVTGKKADIKLAEIILHEASHKFCSTRDHAYCYQPAYKNLAHKMKIENADSYSFAAASFYCDKVLRNRADII